MNTRNLAIPARVWLRSFSRADRPLFLNLTMPGRSGQSGGKVPLMVTGTFLNDSTNRAVLATIAS